MVSCQIEWWPVNSFYFQTIALHPPPVLYVCVDDYTTQNQKFNYGLARSVLSMLKFIEDWQTEFLPTFLFIPYNRWSIFPSKPQLLLHIPAINPLFSIMERPPHTNPHASWCHKPLSLSKIMTGKAATPNGRRHYGNHTNKIGQNW